MAKITFQEKTWAGSFGKKYTGDTAKNPKTLKDTDKLYIQMYGITKTQLNKEFFGNLDRSIKILEVGCNRGIQLMYFQKMGFKNLYGIEANAQIVELAKAGTKNIKKVVKEVYRCSQKYISGLEYYEKRYTEIPYHGQRNLLWKTDFSNIYLDSFKDLKVVKEKKMKYVYDQNMDEMFLLKKNGKHKK